VDPIATWEKILVGIAAVLLLLWLKPGLHAAIERGRAAGERDWGALLLPLGLVVLFVILLIALA
jgi:hypothetical protein